MFAKLLYDVAKDWRVSVPELGRALLAFTNSSTPHFILTDMLAAAAAGEWIVLAQKALSRIPRSYYNTTHGDSGLNALGYQEALYLITLQGGLHKAVQALETFGVGTVERPGAFTAGVAMFDFAVERLFQTMPRDVVAKAKADFLEAEKKVGPVGEACNHKMGLRVMVDFNDWGTVNVQCRMCGAGMGSFFYDWSLVKYDLFHEWARLATVAVKVDNG